MNCVRGAPGKLLANHNFTSIAVKRANRLRSQLGGILLPLLGETKTLRFWDARHPLNLSSFRRQVKTWHPTNLEKLEKHIMPSLAPEKLSKPGHPNVSEAQLLKEAKRGHREAFAMLCEGLSPRLLNTALRITGNREDAEDALQDSLMNAFVHISNFQGNSAFSTWLTRIVMNSALMIRRKNRSAGQLLADDRGRSGEPALQIQIPDRAPNPEQCYIEHERKRILRRAIARLRPRMRAVVEIAQLQENPLRETAKILDISIAAAKGRFFHARAALRKSAALRAIAQAKTEPAA